MSKDTTQTWIRQGATVYALNEYGTNRFSAQVQPGFAIDSRSHKERITTLELEAVAQLMQAAPELLEALKTLLLDVQEYEAWQRPCHALDLARAAIAKAEGKQP